MTPAHTYEGIKRPPYDKTPGEPLGPYTVNCSCGWDYPHGKYTEEQESQFRWIQHVLEELQAGEPGVLLPRPK